MISVLIIRTFRTTSPAGGVIEQRVSRVFELPGPPSIGHRVAGLPGLPSSPMIVGVTLRASLPGTEWQPGFLPPPYTVELEAESPDAMAEAFDRGWTTDHDARGASALAPVAVSGGR